MCAHVCVFAELCPTLYSPPCSSVLAISQVRLWSGGPFPTPGDLPSPEIESVSPLLAGLFFTTSATWEALQSYLGFHRKEMLKKKRKDLSFSSLLHSSLFPHSFP